MFCLVLENCLECLWMILEERVQYSLSMSYIPWDQRCVKIGHGHLSHQRLTASLLLEHTIYLFGWISTVTSRPATKRQILSGIRLISRFLRLVKHGRYLLFWYIIRYHPPYRSCSFYGFCSFDTVILFEVSLFPFSFIVEFYLILFCLNIIIWRLTCPVLSKKYYEFNRFNPPTNLKSFQYPPSPLRIRIPQHARPWVVGLLPAAWHQRPVPHHPHDPPWHWHQRPVQDQAHVTPAA